MIARASRHLGTPSNISYTVDDVFTAPLPLAAFDVVVCIAALHHMDMAAALSRLASLVIPGGTLLILDFFSPITFGDWLAWSVGGCLTPAARLLRSGRLFREGSVRSAWAAHEADDRYSSVAEVRTLSSRLLPGSRVHRLLFRRYSILWRRAA
jgi:SAM-dependent methyltransferase